MKPFTYAAGTLKARLRFLSLLLLILSAATASHAQISLSASAGTTGPTSYTTLKDAFDAINLGTHQGAIIITVNASTTEVATASLNASGAGSASFTSVLIRPGASATPTISGSISAGPVVKLNGANNVMLNGSNNNSGSRDLTITNTSTTTPQVLVVGSVGTTAVTSDTIKNCVLINGAQTSTALILSDATAPGTAGYFNNIGIINNSIQKAYIGMYAITNPTGTNGNGTYIYKNSLNTSGTNSIRLCGLYAQGLYGARIDSNLVGNFEGLNAEFDRAIWLATGTNNTSVTGNTVSGLSYTGATAGYAPIGINISPGVTSASISITGNAITDISSANSGTSMGIYFYSAASGITIEKNWISNIKNSNTGGWGAAGILLTGTLTTSAVNVLNNFVWDIAAYGTNLWTSNANGNGIVADGGGGYNIYYNTVWLNTNQTAVTGTRAAAVFISTGVTAANSINLRNNLLINTQTVGNANSRMALVVTASTSVFNTFNYNDYYATSGNLAGQGTNATIWNTIAQIQSNMGLNGASVSILPVFASSTDLHLPAASNTTLNNLGVSIPAVTAIDIDNDPRTTTPDMGADEFGNCLPVTITSQPVPATVCAGKSATFSVAATNGNVVQWQVNTGSGFTNITNGAPYSGATGNTLTITGATAAMSGYTYMALVSSLAGCPQVSSNAAALTVNARPAVAVTSSGSTTFCTGGTDTLRVPAASGVTYQWLNAGGPLPGANSASYVATTSGSYYVIATSGSTGCADTSVQTVITVGSGPAAVITPSGTQTICQGANIVLSAGTVSGVSYQWKTGGNPIPGATGNTFTTASAGVYTVTVSTGPLCSTTSPATTVNVNPRPTATAGSTTNNVICQGSAVTLNANTGTGLSYQWQRNGGAISGATGSSYSATQAGVYRVEVTSAATTCKDTSAALSITVNPLPPAAILTSAPAAICERDTSVLVANPGAGLSYQWQYNGFNINGATGSSYRAFQDGSYTVQTKDGNGCQRTSAAVALTVHPAPIATITYSAPISFCAGSAVALTAYPGANYSYQWIRDNLDMPGITTPGYLAATTGVYTIRVVDNFGCTSLSDPVPVVVFAKPVPVIVRSGTTLSTGNYAGYQWYLNGTPVGVGGSSGTFIVHEDGVYKVTVTDANGCEGESDLYFLLNLGVGGTPAAAADIRTYPNPATDYIIVENKSPLKLKSLSLLNGVGAVVSRQAAGNAKEMLRTGDLAAGLYYLRIETEGGVVMRKIEVLR